MAKTQLRGVCQCCGRLQAVVNGVMSKHGYVVKEGWFQGVCTGNHYAPMQISRDRADEICAVIRAEAVELDAKSVAYAEGRIHPATVCVSSVTKKEVPWDEASDYKRREVLEALSYKAKRRAELGRAFAKDLEAMADKYFGTELLVVTIEEGPAPVKCGDVKKSDAGSILTVTCTQGARVYWKSDSGRQGWTGIQAWRRFASVEAEVV